LFGTSVIEGLKIARSAFLPSSMEPIIPSRSKPWLRPE
jgi:hypothetical protein